jgi:hypothetical protein
MLEAWISSGPDSGPPEESFLAFFTRWVSDPSIMLFLIFPVAGLITAAVYWALSKPPKSAMSSRE